MHRLWSYGTDKIVRQYVVQICSLYTKIQHEENKLCCRSMRTELSIYTEKLAQEQRLLSRHLGEIERDWDRYMDTESRDAYYAELTQLYLLAGGHWATVQESGQVHKLTHQPPANACPTCGRVKCVCHHPVPLSHRPEAHSSGQALPAQYSRGASKLFKD